jgi:hypothetical protein
MFFPCLIQILSRNKKATEHVQQLTLQQKAMSERPSITR